MREKEYKNNEIEKEKEKEEVLQPDEENQLCLNGQGVALLIIAAMWAMLLSGKIHYDDDNKTNKKTREEKTIEEDANKLTPSPTPTLSPEEIEKQRVLKLVDEYLDYIEDVKVTYPNEKYYPSEKQIDKILKKDETYKTYEHKDTISMKELFKKIEKNSKKFVKENKKYKSAFVTDIYDKDFMGQLHFENALEKVLKEIKQNATNDFKEDICKMEDLKIVFGNLEYVDCPEEFEEPCYGNTSLYKKDENLIIIDYKELKKYEKDTKDTSDYWVYKEILNKELSLVRRNACKHRLNQGQEFDEILGDFANTKVPFGDTIKKAYVDSSYYVENKRKVRNEVDFSDYYGEDQEYESLIFLLGLFNGKTYEEYSNAILDSNPDAFYDFCGAKTKEEKAKLYKILTAMDAVEGRNKIPNKVLKYDFPDYEESEEVIRYNYKIDIFNKVLKDMINYTASHKDFSLEDNLLMFNIVKRNIIKNTDIIDSDNKYDKEFILAINKLENKYLDFLTKFYSRENEVINKDLDDNYLSIWSFQEKDLSEKFPLFNYVYVTGKWNSSEEYETEFKKLINK